MNRNEKAVILFCAKCIFSECILFLTIKEANIFLKFYMLSILEHLEDQLDCKFLFMGVDKFQMCVGINGSLVTIGSVL